MPIEVTAFIETVTPTGPAGNLILLARSLQEAKTPAARIRIVTFVRGSGSNAFIDACHHAGVDIEIIRERYRFDPVIAEMREIVKRHQPDIVQTHNVKSHLFFRLSGLPRLYPWIAFVHGYTAEDFKMKLYNQADRWSLRGADRVVAVCGLFADRLRRWGVREDRILVRHNAVSEIPQAPPEAVAGLREHLGIPAEATVLLSVGRFSPEKAHADLLRGIARLKQQPGLSPFRLVLVGAGPEEGNLRALCAELDLDGEVVFAGTTTNVPLYYSLCDLFILPSHSEGSPNALLEAMMAGKPVVATAVGGVPEIVTHGQTGELVPAGDIEGLAHCVAGLMADPTKRSQLGSAARLWVSTRHSRGEYLNSIVRLYQDLGQLRRGSRRAGSPA